MTAILVADGGELTVLRSLAAFSYGTWDVTWPDSVPEAERPDPGEDRQFGYVADLGREPGPMGRRFVRSDVSITAVEYVDGKPVEYSGISNVEEVLDAAESRTNGGVYAEREITRAGLGALIPYMDFDIGDIVPVLFWNLVLELPVAEIRNRSAVGELVDYPVMVGSSMMPDTAAGEASNRELMRTIAQERRERGVAVNSVASTANAAKSAADSALEATSDNRAYVDEQLADVRSSIADAGGHLETVKELVDEGKRHAETAATLAKQAGDMATKAEGILDTIDPLRDDVVRIHTEVARLGILAANNANKAAAEAALGRQYVETAKEQADKAAEYVATGQKHVDEVKSLAGSASESAAEAQRLVDEASGILESTTADKQAAEKALADAGALLNNIDGKGTSLPDALKEIVRLHQEVLDKHGVILEAHEDTLTLHGEAIRWAAAAASQATHAASSAGLAAQDALRAAGEAGKAASDAATAAGHANRAAEENAKAINTLEAADEKLEEADRKLQDQLDRVKDAERLLAQAVKILAQGVAANSAASQSALMAADENREANAATNLAVETLTEVQKETSRQATTAERVSRDAKTAADAATKAVNAQKATVNDTNDLARLTHFRRTRVFIYERASDSQSETGVKLPWDDRTTALTFDVDSSGAIFKWDGAWEGYVKVTAMSASSRLGISVFDVLEFTTGKYELWDKVSSEWVQSYVIEIFPLWPDKATKNRFYQRGLAGLK